MNDNVTYKTELSHDLKVALINLVVKVGLDAAISIARGIKAATTIEEAIAALEASAAKTWKDYKDETKNLADTTKPIG